MKNNIKKVIGYLMSLALAVTTLVPSTVFAQAVAEDTYRLVNVATTAKITCDGTAAAGEVYDLIDTVSTFDSEKSVFARGGATQILFDLVNPQCVTKLEVINQFRQPTYVLQGSNNNMDYTNIVEITANTGEEVGADKYGNKFILNSITLNNNTAYRYYRIYCPTSSVFKFSEVKLWANILSLPEGTEEKRVASVADEAISVYDADGIKSLPDCNSTTAESAITDGNNNSVIYDGKVASASKRGCILYDLGKVNIITKIRCIYPGRGADFSILASADGVEYDWLYKATTSGPNDTPDDTGVINIPNKKYRYFKFTRTGDTSTIRRIAEFEAYCVQYPSNWWKKLDEGYSWSSSLIAGKEPSSRSAGIEATWLSGMTDGKWEEDYRGVLNASGTGEAASVTYDLGYQRMLGGVKMSYEYRTTAGKLSLYGSNDNTEWILLHGFGENVTLINETDYIEEAYFMHDKYRYVKLAAQYPGVLNVNEIEVYGINEPEKTYYLAPQTVKDYIDTARVEYKKPEYQDYTTSIVGNYLTDTPADRPMPVNISWEEIGGAAKYTLEVAESSDFANDTIYTFEEITGTSYNVYNLKTNSKYYWRVTSDTGVVIGPVSFNTADTVRYINVEKSRNIRDLGGWNGLNQGLVYRGSEINEVEYNDPTTGDWVDHDLGLNEEGIRIFREDLGIKTDLDLRNPNYPYLMGNITQSPLGADVKWLNYQASNYQYIFSSSATAPILKTFADINNYPIYMHCWGGADRTGSFAFLLQGLNGATEEDLAIDFELTSFSTYGRRYRYNSGNYTYASMIEKVKACEGKTLQEKFENCVINEIGLTRAEVSNIQSILSGNGVVFAGEATAQAGRNNEFLLKNMNLNTVTGVEIEGVEAEFSVSGNIVKFTAPQTIGTGKIKFADGNYILFDVEPIAVENIATDIHSYESESEIAKLTDTANMEISLVKDTPDGSQHSLKVVHTKERKGKFDIRYTMPEKPLNGQKFKFGAWFKMNSDVAQDGKDVRFHIYAKAKVTSGGSSSYKIGEVGDFYKLYKLSNVIKVGEWVWVETEEQTWSDDGFIYNGTDTEFSAHCIGEEIEYSVRVTYSGNQNLVDTTGELEYYVDNVSMIFSSPDNTASDELLKLGGGAEAHDIEVIGELKAGESITLDYRYADTMDVPEFSAVEDKNSTRIKVYTTLSNGVKRYYGQYSADEEIVVTPAMATAKNLTFEIIPVSVDGVAGIMAEKTIYPDNNTILEKDDELNAVIVRSNELNSATFISALYTQGKLDSAKDSEVTLVDGYKFRKLLEEEIKTDTQTSKYMIWDSLSSGRALCDFVE